MDKQIIENYIITMQRHIDAANKYLQELAKGYQSPEKANTLLDATMNQVELCCIDMRRLCEKLRTRIPRLRRGQAIYHHREISGEVTFLENGWLDIRLNALLPHCKVLGSTQYVADTITRILNHYRSDGGQLPRFDKAFMAIVEHCSEDCSGVFDQDNKGFKGVINALKGRLFPDDNQFELSLGLFTVFDEDECCHIYVMAEEEAGDFLYQHHSGELFT